MTEQHPQPSQPDQPSQQTPGVPPTPSYRRLTRSSTDRKISGVSGGLARYLGIDPTVVRVLVVIGAIVFFPVVLVAYAVLWAVIPEE